MMKNHVRTVFFVFLLSFLAMDLSHSQVGKKININEAPAELLQTLPWIGPALAQRIVEYRAEQPFVTIEDLLEIPGIGQTGFEEIKNLITVEPSLNGVP